MPLSWDHSDCFIGGGPVLIQTDDEDEGKWHQTFVELTLLTIIFLYCKILTR